MKAFNQVRLGGWTIGTPTLSTEGNDKGINPSNKRKFQGHHKQFLDNIDYTVFGQHIIKEIGYHAFLI